MQTIWFGELRIYTKIPLTKRAERQLNSVSIAEALPNTGFISIEMSCKLYGS